MNVPTNVTIPTERIAAAVAGTIARSNHVIHSVQQLTEPQLREPSALPGWSRLTVIAHLRHITEAWALMTAGAIDGRSVDMYPQGRETRPQTLQLREDESPLELVESFVTASRELDALWPTVPQHVWDWDYAFGAAEPHDRPYSFSRFVALRWTELVLHGTDLDRPELEQWPEDFVSELLPLRLAWLPLARHRVDVDPAVRGTWNFVIVNSNAPSTTYSVSTVRSPLNVGQDETTRTATMTGTHESILGLLLGRDRGPLRITGDEALGRDFKRAFPGP